MPILKLTPAFKSYIWGGNKLISEYNKKYDGDILAESWELSCHKDGLSFISSGDFKGMSLAEYIRDINKNALGKNCSEFDRFPVLIKLIDAKQNLSVQVHPDDEYAQKNEGQYGKTEMWYVVEHEPGAKLYYGLKRNISKKELQERIKNNTILEVLNDVEVKKGDVFFIESGTIHAIGAGIVIAEIQQNSNVTYRVYDYARKDAEGNYRELHIEKAMQTADLDMPKHRSFSPDIASCKYFTVDKIYLDGKKTDSISGEADDSSFIHFLILDGDGIIKNYDKIYEFKKGDSYFITAGSGRYEISGKCEALVTTV